MDTVVEIKNKSSRFDDHISLDFEERFRRRVVLKTDSGYEFFLALEKAAELPVGGIFVLQSGKKIKILAANEELMMVRANSKIELIKASWHIGNRHLNCDIKDDQIVLRNDEIIAKMLIGLGCNISYLNAPFLPLSGAYGIGRTFSHSH